MLVHNDNTSTVQGANAVTARDQTLFIYTLWAHLAAEEAGYTLEFLWQRRSEGLMPEADGLSKPADSGDVAWDRSHVWQHVLPAFDVRAITVDLMASRHNAVCARYWSRYYELGCEQVDFIRSHARLGRHAAAEMAWIYPPFFLIEQVCAIVRRLRLNYLIVHPVMGTQRDGKTLPRWKGALRTLPVSRSRKFNVLKILRPGRGLPTGLKFMPTTGKLEVSHISFI